MTIQTFKFKPVGHALPPYTSLSGRVGYANMTSLNSISPKKLVGNAAPSLLNGSILNKSAQIFYVYNNEASSRKKYNYNIL